MTKEIRKWGDDQQYEAEPHVATDHGVLPNVELIWMTPDPLGAMAAFTGIYEGKVFRSLSEVTDDDRRKALEDVQQTHLQAPLEVIKMHFLFEGVDRAFTHQLVRQRTAVYGQESMRFAVLGALLDATTLPPSLAGTEPTTGREGIPSVALAELLASEDFGRLKATEKHRAVWEYAIGVIDNAYHYLVESGMPAEEARGLLPHATATRIHFVTDMRNLIAHAGNRLCTQAQFHWRLVFGGIVKSIMEHGGGLCQTCGGSGIVEERRDYATETLSCMDCMETGSENPDGWQYKAIAQSNMFRPVCYQLGHCPFKASFDRACTIRDRVDAFAKDGVPSSQWGDDSWMTAEQNHLAKINPAEWLLDPGAARMTAGL